MTPAPPPLTWRVRRFASLSSTNDAALAALAAGSAVPGAVYLAERQTAGRGRQGRRWLAGEGALLFSAVLPARRRPEAASLVAGIAVAEAVRDLGLAAGLKWPNDVELGGRKLAGILVEGRGTLLVVGIGVNANNAVPLETPRAVSLVEALGEPVDREALLRRILANLGELWPVWLADPEGFRGLRARWEALDAARGRRVRAGETEGTADGVDDTGALLVRRPDGARQRAVVGDLTYLEEE